MYTLRYREPVRRGWSLWKSLAVVVAVVMSAAFVASPVAASGPTKYEYETSQHFVLENVCLFPVTLDNTIHATEIYFFDQSGALTRAYAHWVEQDTFSANGKTLIGEPFTFNVEFLFDADGTLVHQYASGVVETVPLPDGSVFFSAGRLDFINKGGPVITPDRGRSGDLAAFCAALAP